MPGFFDAVYRLVRLIPRGKVATYGAIACACGQPHGARAVGYALRALAPDSDVPWQRVINAQGRVSPRMGQAPGEPELQRVLLEREGVAFDADGKVDLRRFGWEGPAP